MTAAEDCGALADALDHLAEDLAAARARRGLSLSEVSADTGLSRTTLWQVEHGTHPRIDTAAVLLRWLARQENQS